MASADAPRSWETKVDHRLLALLDALEKHPVEGARRVAVFVRFQSDPGRLRALGLEVRSVSGSVAVATVTLADMSRVARSTEISFIELAREIRLDVQQVSNATPGSSGRRPLRAVTSVG